MCKYRVEQRFIIPHFCSISIYKGLVTEFMAVKISQNLNLMQKMSAQETLINGLKIKYQNLEFPWVKLCLI